MTTTIEKLRARAARLLSDPDVHVVLPDGSAQPLHRFLVPTALLMVAALLLVSSFFLPYWSLQLEAPQYPEGLRVTVFLTHLEGDVQEVDALNHYLGLPPLDEGGRLERSIAPYAVGAFALLLGAGVFVHDRWAGFLCLPTITFPLAFLADLWYILYTFGHSIDPEAALGDAVDPFTPPLFGAGKIGQFETYAWGRSGLWVAFLSVAVTGLALWYHRRAYKPLVEARRSRAAKGAGPDGGE